MSTQNDRKLYNILTSYTQGLLTQEETINAILKEAGYETSFSAGAFHKERAELQDMQRPEKDGGR